MFEWLTIIFLAVAALVVWFLTPSPENWIIGSVITLSVFVSAYILIVQKDETQSTFFAAFGFVVLGIPRVYEWAIKPILPQSQLVEDYGLIVVVVLFIFLLPICGVGISKMLLQPSTTLRVIGGIIATFPAIIAVLGAVAYWYLFIAFGPPRGMSVEKQQIIAIAVIPGLITLALWVGLALHRVRAGLVEMWD